jgi:hypothetical protein
VDWEGELISLSPPSPSLIFIKPLFLSQLNNLFFKLQIWWYAQPMGGSNCHGAVMVSCQTRRIWNGRSSNWTWSHRVQLPQDLRTPGLCPAVCQLGTSLHRDWLFNVRCRRMLVVLSACAFSEKVRLGKV